MNKRIFGGALAAEALALTMTTGCVSTEYGTVNGADQEVYSNSFESDSSKVTFECFDVQRVTVNSGDVLGKLALNNIDIYVDLSTESQSQPIPVEFIVKAVVDINDLPDADSIAPGQQLIMPKYCDTQS
jgi:hypothetical protein